MSTALRPALLSALLALAASGASAQGGAAWVEQVGVTLGPATADALGPGAGQTERLLALIPADLAPSANAIVVDQSGTGNRVDVEQTGEGNLLALIQGGSDLVATVVQSGTGNRLLAAIDGSGNELESLQDGQNNTYDLQLSGSGTFHRVLQVGEDLTLNQVVAPGMRPASVEQRGSGFAIQIDRR